MSSCQGQGVKEDIEGILGSVAPVDLKSSLQSPSHSRYSLCSAFRNSVPQAHWFPKEKPAWGGRDRRSVAPDPGLCGTLPSTEAPPKASRHPHRPFPLSPQDAPYLDLAPYMPDYYKPQYLLDFEDRLPSSVHGSDSLSLNSFNSVTSTNLEWDDSAIAPSSEGEWPWGGRQPGLCCDTTLEPRAPAGGVFLGWFWSRG